MIDTPWSALSRHRSRFTTRSLASYAADGSAATGSGSYFRSCGGWAAVPTAQHYGISSLDEARAYLAHDVLGPRLRECTRLVAAIDGRSVDEIFGWPDNLKVRSSMTLFAHATDDNTDFRGVLDKFYEGEEDPATVERLSGRR